MEFNFYRNTHICIKNNTIFQISTQNLIQIIDDVQMFLYTKQNYIFKLLFLGFKLLTLIQIDITYVERLKWKDA
jgi:hypothetical protein